MKKQPKCEKKKKGLEKQFHYKTEMKHNDKKVSYELE